MDTHSKHGIILTRSRLTGCGNCLRNLNIQPHLVQFLFQLLQFFAEKVVGRMLRLVQLKSNENVNVIQSLLLCLLKG